MLTWIKDLCILFILKPSVVLFIVYSIRLGGSQKINKCLGVGEMKKFEKHYVTVIGRGSILATVICVATMALRCKNVVTMLHTLLLYIFQKLKPPFAMALLLQK